MQMHVVHEDAMKREDLEVLVFDQWVNHSTEVNKLNESLNKWL